MYNHQIIDRTMRAEQITNEQLAGQVAVSRAVISALRNGSWDGKFSTFIRVCKALKLEPAEVIKKAA